MMKMKLVEHFLHLFTPRHTNNHRPKILHFSGILSCLVFLLIFQLVISFIHVENPTVLGYASNITINDLLNDTNEKRFSFGLAPLVLNQQLNSAAEKKAEDMFSHQYWAHNSPEGKEPWSFITGAGYNYIFAGENLARDFADSGSVVSAWMDSPSHRENLLNERFKEIGFAVVNGKYGDSETTLVVQMFGTKTEKTPSVAAPEVPSPSPSMEATLATAPATVKNTPPLKAVLPASRVIQKPLVDILALSKVLTAGTALFLIAVLLTDALLVYRRKTVRISGNNLAHIILLGGVLITILFLGRGVIT